MFMQCEVCQSKEATIHLTEIADGVRTEMHLCEQCAQEQGVGTKSYIPLNELLSNLLSVGPKGEEPAQPSRQLSRYALTAATRWINSRRRRSSAVRMITRFSRNSFRR